MEPALQLWLHKKHPDVALHLDHNKQQFKGTQKLAAVGALVICEGAKGLVDVPTPSRRRA